ncbi:MAG: type II toxin-antitoxin system RelE/ParE family toxin [Bdellovibrionota bacterium]
MALRIDIAKDVGKFLKKIPKKHSSQIAKKIISLSENPKAQDVSDLKGYGFKRADQGEYRIIFDVKDETLYVILVGKRNDDEVYKKLSRK